MGNEAWFVLATDPSYLCLSINDGRYSEIRQLEQMDCKRGTTATRKNMITYVHRVHRAIRSLTCPRNPSEIPLTVIKIIIFVQSDAKIL
jgi:hypothetical protein